ncbi:VWA domain-containing protein [Nostoc sp. ATCC 53789]|uniref:VWA domain-containing protein n=1 Tax=Nostoc sp. ATCC 53789 TaxID=76335 RepID=UPI000DEC93E4|nr:VWA domain-containing protein [Nostoc sp. ATCC 53789]QHG21215.1 VWA domain-containing protein [Nostoc sp. ATCC 53789]RCJ16895.1 hypothetical protein A6V25_29870 [Nostoc sp. ATCC 53789]
MKRQPKLPSFLWELFDKLRRRHKFALGIDDYEALLLSLQAGFGWSSERELQDLCNSLWAKSVSEQEILNTLFEQLVPKEDNWELSSVYQRATAESTGNTEQAEQEEDLEVVEPQQKKQIIPITQSSSSLPEISLKNVQVSQRPFIFVPQFPLTYREVAQTWRRLRRPVRIGAANELDIDATIARRCQQGVPGAVVLRPRRRNVARLLLLIDRQGSMTPFHPFCEEVCKAIREASRVEDTALYYFHNVPAEGADKQVLKPIIGEIFPKLDTILSAIQPLERGFLYEDPGLLSLQPVEKVLQKYATDAFVIVISDAGAKSNSYNVSRLLDTIAFFKAIRRYCFSYVWLNPLPKSDWQTKNNTATQIARHIPMFSLDKEGIQQAVNILLGHLYNIDKPL